MDLIRSAAAASSSSSGCMGGWSPSECMRRILDPPQSSTEETVCFLQELTSNDEAGGVELSSLSDCSIRASC